jgi:CBS domain-containing protein
MMVQVSQVMTRGVRALAPGDTMQFAAQAMEELNVGSVPVCDGKKLVGMVTDRDITVRGVAQGLAGSSTPLRDVMSGSVRWCYDDQPIDEVMDQMRSAQIRRLPVVDREKHLVGIVSLGDVATKVDGESATVAGALADISEPAEPDRSGVSAASGAAGGGATAQATHEPSGKPSGRPARR